MRGRFFDQGGMFSYIQPDRRIPTNHPLREVRELVREVLKELSHTFGKLYSHEGRPSIPLEQLLSALLLQVFYSIRSERQLMEQRFAQHVRVVEFNFSQSQKGVSMNKTRDVAVLVGS